MAPGRAFGVRQAVRNGIVAVVVIVGAPFPYISSHIIEPITVGGK